MTLDTERRLAAILNADAVGFTRLMADDETATVETITAYQNEMCRLVEQHRGRIVDFPGDNLLAEFQSATQAVLCALTIQRMLGARNADLPATRRMDFRLAVHLGEVAVDGDRIFGDGINIAARLEKLAEPGGIVVSRQIFDAIETKLEIGFEDLGEQSLKNYPKPIRVYRLLPDRTPASSAAPEPRSVRGWMGAVAAIVAVALGLFLWRQLDPTQPDVPRTPAHPMQIRSLAVLPLENLSGAAAQEYFSVGMTEALISHLAEIASLSLVSRTSVMQYSGAKLPLPEIASKLGVDAVVEGSVLRVGDSVRITVQLIDARSDRHLWAGSYQRDLHDVLALQSEVARAIAREVQLVLSPADRARLATPRPVDPEAYEAFLQGTYFQMQQGAANHAKAAAYLERAVGADPSYPLAWAKLADAYT